MADRARRKERQRLKRQEKRRAMVRSNSGSPYRHNREGEIEACYINAAWREQGLANILTLKRVRGNLVLGAYLVDLWCCGLKDAWGRLNISMHEFDDMRDRASGSMEIVRIDAALARRLVAGAVRFAQQNGFALPPRYDRWTALLGIDDWRSAELADFSINGKLRYVGSLEDLRRRLIDCSVDEFLARPDVQYIARVDDADDFDDEWLEDDGEFDDDNGEFDDDDDDDDAQPQVSLNEIDAIGVFFKARALDAIRQWCHATGREPHPLLAQALDVTHESIAQARDEEPDSEELSEAVVDSVSENAAQLIAMETPENLPGIIEALKQLAEFNAQFATSDELRKALGLPDLDKEDDDSTLL